MREPRDDAADQSHQAAGQEDDERQQPETEFDMNPREGAEEKRGQGDRGDDLLQAGDHLASEETDLAEDGAERDEEEDREEVVDHGVHGRRRRLEGEGALCAGRALTGKGGRTS